MKRSLVIYDYVLMFYACLTLETFDSPLEHFVNCSLQ